MLAFQGLAISFTFFCIYSDLISGWLAIAINSILLFFQLLKFLHSPKSTFKKNIYFTIFDLLRSIFIYIVIFATLINGDSETLTNLKVFLLITITPRAILEWRIFQRYRYILKMVIRIYYDIFPFLTLFLFYLINYATMRTLSISIYG